MKEKIKLKDIFNRNLVLILIIQVLSDSSNNWASAFINMGATAAGVGVGAIGIGASVYTIAALITRMPAGSIADSDKKKIGLIGAIIVRTICIFLLGTFGTMGDANFIAARALYGFGWCLVGIILPAVVAMMMDKKVMGTTYAFLSVAQSLAKNYSKAGGVYVYQNFGMFPALICAAGFAVLAILLIGCLDFNDERIIQATSKKKKKGGLKALNLKYIPVCFMMSLVVLAWSAHSQYNNVIAAERGIDIASILVVTGTIASVISFVTNTLCDFIHPKWVLFFLYVCLGAGIFLTGHAYTYGAFMAAEVLCTIGSSYSKIISIFLFKNCDITEKGSVHATNYLATDVRRIISGGILGALMSIFDYQHSYDMIAVLTFVIAVLFILFGSRLMKSSPDTLQAEEKGAA